MPPKVKFAFTPYPLQQDIIDHLDGKRLNAEGEPYRFFVTAIGRQSGKSWLAKYEALERSINRNQEVMWVAPTIPTARKHWNNLVSMVEKSGIPTKKINQSDKQIVFPGGGEISIRSAIEPDNLRGGTLDLVILDEAAFFRNGEYVWYSVILPMVTASHGVVLFLSTPNGRNWFYNIFNQGNDPRNLYYKSWTAPSTISPYQDPKLLEVLRTTMPDYQYREEFLAEFLADGSGVFSGVEKAAVVEPINAPIPGHSYVCGIDFGFNHDATGFTVIDKYTRQQVFGKRFFNYGTVGTIKTLVSLLRQWQPEITHLEKNGLGEALFEVLKLALKGNSVDIEAVLEEAQSKQFDPVPDNTERDFKTDWGGRLRAVHMDNPTKRAMVERLATDIEYGRLQVLRGVVGEYGDTQMNEMSTYQRERTSSGMEITYNAAEGSMDDTISTLYLAYRGVPKAQVAYLAAKEQLKETKVNPFRNGGHKALQLRTR